MEIKTVSLIGLGALGVLFGDHLSRNMPEGKLKVIADQGRIDKYEKNGVFINGRQCNFQYILPETHCEPADLVIFAVKYNNLEEAIEAVRHHVGEYTNIISLLNGITSESIIGQSYGMDKMVYCVAQGMVAVKVENKLTCENMGLLCIGDREPGQISEKVKRVADFFARTGLPHEVETDMYRRLWGKLMLNVGVNQTIAVYETKFAGVQAEGEARDMMIAAMKEVIAVSEKEGVHLTEQDLKYWLDVLSTLDPTGKPSMRQDVEAKRYSEVELFSGTIIHLGKKYGVPTPVNQKFYDWIRKTEDTYQRI
ncbi:2-dehydropantoate 2-reductase [Desulfuribacillus stibiiarsenatis]|uniref:2-dehydropantoate 2-reductase n=1 Tax=Desulfuribacillus stibiiarsenatis TaxID=1390249 RepID=A0A1E5L3H2_9FIRM|nr:2-dehydropantoate 2-reductase [Desulfuribacillus stibiiarsenatis]OEH84688.1 2-dehydropantoate 2-reductase [Desulfuribacillus stibiiarsenatis]